MFWINNLNELFNPVLIPTENMTLEEKLNTISRLILFIGIISAFVFNDSRYILFIIIMLIISIIIYNFQKKNLLSAEKFLEDKNLDIIDNKICTKPTVDNPFMNPTLNDIKYNSNKPNACSIDNSKINNLINDSFYSRVFREAGDIYGKLSSERQFYTVPSTSIPNDQTSYAEWLYKRGKTCKENNGEQCYNNLYKNYIL
jgi:hypothetical protein